MMNKRSQSVHTIVAVSCDVLPNLADADKVVPLPVPPKLRRSVDVDDEDGATVLLLMLLLMLRPKSEAGGLEGDGERVALLQVDQMRNESG